MEQGKPAIDDAEGAAETEASILVRPCKADVVPLSFPDFRDYPQPARPELDMNTAGGPLRQGS